MFPMRETSSHGEPYMKPSPRIPHESRTRLYVFSRSGPPRPGGCAEGHATSPAKWPPTTSLVPSLPDRRGRPRGEALRPCERGAISFAESHPRSSFYRHRACRSGDSRPFFRPIRVRFSRSRRFSVCVGNGPKVTELRHQLTITVTRHRLVPEGRRMTPRTVSHRFAAAPRAGSARSRWLERDSRAAGRQEWQPRRAGRGLG
jgi:hypothetical protein